MSYILDALKRSDRSRQLNTTHELSYAHLNTEKRNNTFWLKVLIAVLSLVSLVSLSSIYFINKKNDDSFVSDVKNIKEPVINAKVNSEPEQIIEKSQVINTSIEPIADKGEILNRDSVDDELKAEDISIVQQAPSVKTNSDRRSLFELTTSKDQAAEELELTVKETKSVVESEAVDIQNIESVSITTDFSNYENYKNVRSEYGLPAMHLDVLLHHSEVAQRKAYINMSMYREGDTTSDGAKVIEIGKEAVLLNYSSHDFILTAK